MNKVNGIKVVDMRVKEFNTAIAEAIIRPKTIRISPDFLKLLQDKNLVQQGTELIKGHLDLGGKALCYEDIWLDVSSELSIAGQDFELPPSSRS